MPRPPVHVLEAFGVEDEPELLPGGRGASWRVGPLVLKPLDRAPTEIAWQAEVLSGLQSDGVRVAPPVPLIVDGWTAWTYVEGTHEPGRWLDIIAAGERLHDALAAAPRPADILDMGVEPWATGDRVAWDGEPFAGLVDAQYLLRALIYRGVTSIVGGTEWRSTIELARTIAAR